MQHLPHLQRILDSCPDWLLDVLRDFRRLCEAPEALKLTREHIRKIALKRMGEYERTGEFTPLCGSDNQYALTIAEKIFLLASWHDRLCRQMELRTEPVGFPTWYKNPVTKRTAVAPKTVEEANKLLSDAMAQPRKKPSKIFRGFMREGLTWYNSPYLEREKPVIRRYVRDIAKYFDEELDATKRKPTKGNGTGKRGPKQVYDPAEDKKIYDARQATKANYEELAREHFGDKGKRREVGKAIDRHRHRLKRMGWK